MRALLASLVLLAAVPAAADDPKPTAAQLAKDRTNLAARLFASSLSRFEAGPATVEDVARWSARWLDASLDGATGKAVTAALAAHAERMRDLEEKAVAASKTGRTYVAEAEAASYFRIEAELWVARGRR